MICTCRATSSLITNDNKYIIILFKNRFSSFARAEYITQRIFITHTITHKIKHSPIIKDKTKRRLCIVKSILKPSIIVKTNNINNYMYPNPNGL